MKETLIPVTWENLHIGGLDAFYRGNAKLMQELDAYKTKYGVAISVCNLKWSTETEAAVKARFMDCNRSFNKQLRESRWSWQILGYGCEIDDTVPFGCIKMLMPLEEGVQTKNELADFELSPK